MQLTSDRIDEESLVALGIEATRLVVANDLATLHQRFGYALAFSREPVTALGEDLSAALAELEATSVSKSAPLEPRVTHFKSNGAGLVSIIECRLTTNNQKQVLLELAVTKSGSVHHVTLEQLSAGAKAGTSNAA